MPVVEATSLPCLVGASRTDKDTQADHVTLPLRAPGGPGHDRRCPCPSTLPLTCTGPCQRLLCPEHTSGPSLAGPSAGRDPLPFLCWLLAPPLTLKVTSTEAGLSHPSSRPPSQPLLMFLSFHTIYEVACIVLYFPSRKMLAGAESVLSALHHRHGAQTLTSMFVSYLHSAEE